MEKQGAFLFYRSFYEALKDLPADLYKEIMDAVMLYALDGIDPELSPMANCAFQLIKPQIDANNRRRENGNKGGRPKTKPAETETEQEPNPNQTETKVKPNHNQNETKTKPNETNPEPKEKDKSIKIKEKEKDIDKAISITTAEPVKTAHAEPVLADCEAIPLNDGTEWRPTVEALQEWERLYPGINVRQKIGEMRAWCLSNPTRKKTLRGVSSFVNSWLSREQNRAPARAQPAKKTRFDNFPGHGTDYDALMWGMVAGGKQ